MKKQRFLFISKYASISDTARQVLRGRHEVKLYIDDPSERDIANGFVPKVRGWKNHVRWADVIVFDHVEGFGEKAHELRKLGKRVIGGTPYTDRLEDDRAFGQEELKRHDISILSYEEFTNFNKAIRFVRRNPDEYVIKPSGAAQNTKRLLFVGMEKDGSDVIRVLEAYKRVWSDHIKVFQLQRKVTGVEVAVGAFFNGHRFIEPICVNFEHKKLFPGDIGPATGEMGTLMFWSEPNRLFNETLKKMETTLAREGYVGYIDVNCIVNGNGIYPLEFTSRFGYPTISIQQEAMTTSIGEFFFQLASGEDFELKVRTGFQIGVRVVVPPFPYRDKRTFDVYSKEATIVFKNKNGKYPEGIHIEDVKLVNGQWTVTGSVGVAIIVCGLGQTVEQAQQQAYNRIANILIPNMYYRTDIGDRWTADSDRLHNWGYLREQ